ncbi:MAG: hypothetical protein VKI83_06185 [Synechococcaceae cyanobacterium]|nr:hypothetical protein [Synechococcaceae cyanobacterium]
MSEWRVELEQHWRSRTGVPALVLLVAGLDWLPGAGRDPQRPHCRPLPLELRPVLQQLAQDLGARLIELDGRRLTSGVGRDDLLEAPLLLVATRRPAAELFNGELLREQPGQLLSLWCPPGDDGRLRRQWHRGFVQLGAADLERDLPAPLAALHQLGQEGDTGAARTELLQRLLLPLALLTGLGLWQWSSRVLPGLVLIAATWWWLERQPGLRERNRRWCRQQLLALQRLWADFGIPERVRDQLFEGRRSVAGDEPQLLQALQAHRLHLELQRPEGRCWQRADLIDALQLFEGLQRQLRRGEQLRRQRQLWLRLLAGVLGLTLLLAVALAQSWTDALVLPTAALLALFNLLRPIPLLLPLRRQRGVAALEGPLATLRRAQRCDELSALGGLRQEVEQAVLKAGRELVDVVNDSLTAGGATGSV